MRSISFAGMVGAAAITFACAQALAQPVNVSVGADEIAESFKGKTCTTKGGSKFTFNNDGHYAYDGLWRSGGHYVIGDGTIIVTFDSGLRRFFAISRKGEALYMEQTIVSCNNPTSSVTEKAASNLR
jgi:hypothetical protein